MGMATTLSHTLHNEVYLYTHHRTNIHHTIVYKMLAFKRIEWVSKITEDILARPLPPSLTTSPKANSTISQNAMGRNIKWWSKAVAASLNVKVTPLLMTFQFHSTADNFPASGTIIDCKCQVAFSLLPPKAPCCTRYQQNAIWQCVFLFFFRIHLFWHK